MKERACLAKRHFHSCAISIGALSGQAIGDAARRFGRGAVFDPTELGSGHVGGGGLGGLCVDR